MLPSHKLHQTNRILRPVSAYLSTLADSVLDNKLSRISNPRVLSFDATKACHGPLHHHSLVRPVVSRNDSYVVGVIRALP